MGPDDIPTVRVESLLARALHRQGELREAEDLYRHAVSRQRVHSPPNFLAESLIGLGAVLCDQDIPDEAEPIITEGLEINQQALSEDDWRIAGARIELAGSLIQQNRLEEADEQLQIGVELLEQSTIQDRWINSRAIRFRNQLDDRSTQGR